MSNYMNQGLFGGWGSIPQMQQMGGSYSMGMPQFGQMGLFGSMGHKPKNDYEQMAAPYAQWAAQQLQQVAPQMAQPAPEPVDQGLLSMLMQDYQQRQRQFEPSMFHN